MIDNEELYRLLQKLEIPCVSKNSDSSFSDTRRLDAIQEEVEKSNSRYRLINGKKNYYKLYGQMKLEDLSKEYDRVILVSSHADNLQSEPRYQDVGDEIRGIFDNAGTNAVCTYIMKYASLPQNVLFGFTSDEEYGSKGAKKLAKKLKKYFGEGNVDVIVLDVTYGWQDGVDFTIENDFIYEKYQGELFIKKVCQAANDSGYSWQFLMADEDDKSMNFDEYISSDTIAGYMKKYSEATGGCKTVVYAEGPDESAEYDENDLNVFSLCLPCSADSGYEMHSPEGFMISKRVVCNYTDFLMKVLGV